MLPPTHRIRITQPPQNIILFELDLEVKFPLLRLLQFLSESKVLFIAVLKKLVIEKYPIFVWQYSKIINFSRLDLLFVSN